MTHSIRAMFGLAIMLVGALASGQDAPSSGLRGVVDPTKSAPAAPAPADPNAAEAPPASPADPGIALMHKVAQLMIVTLEGVSSPTSLDRQVLFTLPPGGIIVPQVTDPESAADYVHAVRAFSSNAFEQLPFLVGVDLFAQEKYAKEARTQSLRVPPMLDFAAAGPSAVSATLFGQLAENVRAMGFDFHLGPSLALASAPETGGGSLFSFGGDVATTAAFAQQINDAMHANGITWIPMGFPGGGGMPPVLITPRSQLRDRDLKPYGLIAQGPGAVPMLNVGTALVPTMDDATPACFSPIVIGDLRGDVFGYSGIVVAGPLDVKEVTISRRPERAAIEALLAGADMLYWSMPGPHVLQATVAIVDGIQKNAIDEKVIDRAIDRIRAYKKSLPPPREFKEVEAEAKALLKKREKSSEPVTLTRMTITLIKNDPDALPLSEASQPTAVIGAYGTEQLKGALEEYMEPIAERPIRYAKHSGRFEPFETDRIVKLTDAYRTIIITVSNEIEGVGQRNLIRDFRRLGKRVIVVVMGYPRDMTPFEDANAIVLAYGNPNQPGDTMLAVADVLMGNAPVEILPPLRDLVLTAGEASSFDAFDVLRSPVGRLPLTVGGKYVAGYSVPYRPTLAVDTIHWDFGDGAKSSAAVATHAYKKPGEYIVTLTISGKRTKSSASGQFRVQVQ